MGVDGEGVDRPDGEHEYVLLSVGDQSLHHEDGRRLTTDDVFAFLWQAAAHYGHGKGERSVAFVGFALGYDMSQWWRDLPEREAWLLCTDDGMDERRRADPRNPTPFPVRWSRWEFDTIGTRRFKLRPWGSREPWLYVCDTFGFWQSSFLAAIDPKAWPDSPVCSPDEYAVILAGKARRADYLVAHGEPVDPEMIAYNVAENALLARLMDRMNEGLRAMGIKLTVKQWFGPGQAAQAWLNQTAGEHTGDNVRAAAPDGVHDAARGSYFGGWFEITCHGPVPGPTHEYDINSAYPAVIAELPCLLHGRWRHAKRRPAGSARWRLVRASVRGSDPYLGAMLHRNEHGNVYRPHETEGWFWQHELDAAAAAGLVDRVVVREAWTYLPCDCPPPLRSIRDLYRHRLDVGKNTPAGKAAKLVYNSTYGKFAQSIGNPKYGNAVYASLITAGCRTMILEAIASHPSGSRAVRMVATDGLYVEHEHPTLDVDPSKLGAWDHDVCENLSLFKPGVYWHDKARDSIARGESLPKFKSRGVSPRALAPHLADIDRQWSAWERPEISMEELTAWLDGEAEFPDKFPQVTLTLPFSVISPALALHRKDWGSCGRVEHDTAMTHSGSPRGKRNELGMYRDEDGILRSEPYPGRDGPSVPYDKRFGQAMEDEAMEAPGDDEDGALAEELFNG